MLLAYSTRSLLQPRALPTPPTPLLLAAADGLARAAHAALGAAGPLGTVVVEAAVHGVGSPLVFAGAVVAAVAGLVLRMAAVAAAP